MIGLSTACEQRMRQQVKNIYDALVRCGYPGLLNANIAKDQGQMGAILTQYFQPTPKREALIQWLIVQLWPLYQPQSQKTQKKGNSKIKKMLVWLWRLGVLPYSKHTKNLDYQKYVEALIGEQNAIELVYNLCTLLLESKKALKARQDNQFHFFLEDVFKNYDSLISLDYDPYKISFPPAYSQLTQEEFQSKYAEFLIKIQNLKAENTNKDGSVQSEAKYETIFKDFQSNKGQFLKAYQTLATKMKKTIAQNQSMVGTWKKGSIEEYKGRTISVSSELPSLYRRYKQRLKLTPLPLSEVTADAKSIHQLITCLNSLVQL